VQNGDGNMDLWTVNGNKPWLVYLGDGTGAAGLTEVTDWPGYQGSMNDGYQSYVKPCVADFDGDQIDDVYTPTYTNRLNALFVSTGEGNFVRKNLDTPGWLTGETATVEMQTLWSNNCAVGDMNGDGSPDVFIANYKGGSGDACSNEILINDGAGNFKGSIAPGGEKKSKSVSMCDFTNNGILDAVVTNKYSISALMINDGAGSFVATEPFIANAYSNNANACGDFDADGDADIIEGRWHKSDLLWVNDGAGSFTQDSSSPAGSIITRNGYSNTQRTWAIDTADFNGDGLLDIWFAMNRPADRVLMSDGVGGFVEYEEGPAVHVPAGESGGTCFTTNCDFNNDGLLDIYMGNDGDPNRILMAYSL
jgi:hypothetical protein